MDSQFMDFRWLNLEEYARSIYDWNEFWMNKTNDWMIEWLSIYQYLSVSALRYKLVIKLVDVMLNATMIGFSFTIVI